ncbi:Cleavage and polyadenylation specificity factor subunit 5 [Thelohanellus kitauei]|uniref:Cleavage and polyadenylation specificity factor subunit 5 n=1 Tax=Thelohanellus kitauei TaxID=669202 RepID=A0A0C2NDK2_THEKT|nr:Cleavage and polyadenylation specificity factor subunit 5 [Thelohanellus kitauei]
MASFSLNSQTMHIYNLANYTFGTKEALFEKDASTADKFIRLRNEFKIYGMRRTVEAVLVVHQYKTPHVLLFQIGSSFFKLPGGELLPGEDEVEGIIRLLNELLTYSDRQHEIDWSIVDTLCTWWRPNYENPQYPYIPPHITKPKEMRKVFIISAPDSVEFAVPRNFKLVAAPVFELLENNSVYGPVISTLPYHLSKYNFAFD